MPGLLFWRRWLSLIEQLDVVVGGERVQLVKAQQHVKIVTASCRGQLQGHEWFQQL